MIRAVFHVSVLVSGIISPRGSPAELLRAWRSGEFDLVVCPMLVSELTRALRYRKLERYIEPTNVNPVVDAIVRAATPVPDPDDVPTISRDPRDDYLFAVARAWADLLVSVDRDVLETEEPGVRVFTPGGFRELLEARRN